MPAILFSQMEPPKGWEAEFNDWYNNENIPQRLVLPGFLRTTRYVQLDDPSKFLAVHDLSDLRALESPEYLRLGQQPSEKSRRMLANVAGFTRFTCVEERAGSQPSAEVDYLAALAFKIEGPELSAFDRWRFDDHPQKLQRVAGCTRSRQYRVVSGKGGDWTHIALHEFSIPPPSDFFSSALAELQAGSTHWIFKVVHRAFSATER